MKTQDKRLRKHLSYSARSAGIPVRDLVDVWKSRGITDGVAAIRDRVSRTKRITISEARRRYDVAVDVANKVQRDKLRGDYRRENAKRKPQLTVNQRKLVAIRPMIGNIMPGGLYSGSTEWEIKNVPRDDCESWTTITNGDQYSRDCTFHRSDALHHILVNFADLVAARHTPVPRKVDDHLIIRATQMREGVYQVETITTIGKSVASRTRYVADQGDGMWYLGKTERGAVTALNRAVRNAEASRKGVVTGGTCRSWGWCSDGIMSWCKSRGIRRDLRSRIRKGTSSKAIARLITRQGGPKTAYDRRLMAAAGM